MKTINPKTESCSVYHLKVWKNLLFTPALYRCNSDAVETLISELAGAKRTSPSITTSLDDPAHIAPSPTMTRKMDGPGIAGNTVDAPLGRMQRSTSNSSKGGRYLVMYGLKGNPFKISGKPWIRTSIIINDFATKSCKDRATQSKFREKKIISPAF